MKEIKTDKAPLPVGAYSQAVSVNGFLFISGQIGIDPETGELKEGIKNQTEQIFKNIEEILKEAGIGRENIVKTTIFLRKMENFSTVNKLYKEFFKHCKIFPARSTVEVSNLPLNAEIEIECVAKI